MWPYTEQEVDDLSSPRGELAARTVAVPANSGPSGDVSGGWIMSLMDSAGTMTAGRHAAGRVATRSVTDMTFHAPVKVGDLVCCHVERSRVKRSSAAFHIEIWVQRGGQGRRLKVTSAEFTFVALDQAGRPRPFAANEN